MIDARSESIIPKLRLERIPGYQPEAIAARPPMLRSLSGTALLRGSPRNSSSGEITRRRSGTESSDSAAGSPRSAASPRDDGSPRVLTGSPRSPSRLQPFTLVTPPPRQPQRSPDHENFLLQNEFDSIMSRLYFSLHDSAAASDLHAFCDRCESHYGEYNPMLRSVYMTELRKVNAVTPVMLRHLGVLNRLVHYCEYMNAFWLDTLYEDSSFLIPAYLQTVFATGYYVEPNRRRWLAGSILQRYRDTANPCALQALAALFAAGITCSIGSLYGKLGALISTYTAYVWFSISSAIFAKACRQRRAAALAQLVSPYLREIADRHR